MYVQHTVIINECKKNISINKISSEVKKINIEKEKNKKQIKKEKLKKELDKTILNLDDAYIDKISGKINEEMYNRVKEKLEEKYHMTFPFGASKKVTVFAKEFLAKYGEEELNKIVKKNFANYNEVVSK